MSGQHSPARNQAASAVQYVLLGGFAAVAAGISAQGLTGFARSNMGLRGPWPYLLFFALDGAAGVCAVLLAQRAARADGGLAPRLAVWGLVAASATFNWTHAPRHPAAPEAFGVMPVIAAVLFEFCLREVRLRSVRRTGRKLGALGWLHPAERLRVQMHLAADGEVTAESAARRVRIEQAARRLYQLRAVLHTHDRQARHSAVALGRVRRAERRTHAALARAGFSDPAIAAEVLRQVQVLTMAATLARLDYTTPAGAHAVISNLITAPVTTEPSRHPHPQASAPPDDSAPTRPAPDRALAGGLNGHRAGGPVTGPAEPARRLTVPTFVPATADGAGQAGPCEDIGETALAHPAVPDGTLAGGLNGQPDDRVTGPGEPAQRLAVTTPVPAVPAHRTGQAGSQRPDADAADADGRDAQLIAAATRIVADARHDGSRLSQAALAEKLRGQGYSIANDRLRWLSAVSGLAPRHE